MRKIILIILLLGVGSVAGWKVLDLQKSSSHRGGKRENMRTAEIVTGDISDEVTAQGKLEAKEYVDVGTQVSGQLKKLHVNIGDEVKQGQLLAEIDPRIYQTKVDADLAHIKTLNAQLAEQQADLALAQKQHARNTQLIKSAAVSHDELEQTEAALKAGEAKVAALKAEIEESQSTLDGDKTNLTYTTITAPMSGTVVDVPLREGQTVNASQSAPTILRISNLDVMTVRAQVAEADVMQLKPGMPVYFTTMGNMERHWQATVRQILPTPEIISDVVLYDVLIDAENKDRQLMTSMSTQVFFDIGSAKGVPLIPVEALTRRDKQADNDKGAAYIVKVAVPGAKPEERTIHIGLMDRTNAQVVDGLAAGDKIVLPPLPESSSAQKSGGRGFGPRL